MDAEGCASYAYQRCDVGRGAQTARWRDDALPSIVELMSDALYCDRRFKCLTIVDEGTREALGIVPDTSLPAAWVVSELEQIGSVRGLPQRICIDNGPEMLAKVFTD